MKPLWQNLSSLCLCIFLFYGYLPVSSQPDSNNSRDYSALHHDSTSSELPDRNKLILATAGQFLAYSATFVALNNMWYKEFPRSSFHFYNDINDWQQMDKMGHMASAYHLNRASSKTFRWAGLDKKRSALFGAASAMTFMTAIEVLDGLSDEWGFSLGDVLANTIGAVTFVGQELYAEKQFISWKYSFHQSGLEEFRPDLLGKDLVENLVKDYNGMTIWLSFPIAPAFGIKSGMPEWLNLAVGYGAYGMLGSNANPSTHQGRDMPVLQRYRRWYLAPDIDFSRIPTKSRWLKSTLWGLNVFKLPAPAVEYNSKYGWSFHLMFF